MLGQIGVDGVVARLAHHLKYMVKRVKSNVVEEESGKNQDIAMM